MQPTKKKRISLRAWTQISEQAQLQRRIPSDNIC